MKYMASIFAISLVWAGFAGSADARGKQMSAKDIKAKVIGKTMSYRGKTSGTQIIHAGGRITVRDSKFGKLTGKWWFKGSRYCRRLSRDGGKSYGKTGCFRLFDNGGGRYSTSTGYTFTVR